MSFLLLVVVGRCTRDIKFRVAVAKAAFNEERALFTSKMDLELMKKPVKCYIWRVAVLGAKT
jgi:hypothetical protein